MSFYTPELGRHEDVPNEVYHLEWDAVNSSMLSNLRRTPAHAQYFRKHPQQTTWAKDFGSAVHCALLEPDRFEREYIVELPPSEKRTAEGKGWPGWKNTNEYKKWRTYMADDGYGILSQDDIDKCRAIQDHCHQKGTLIAELMEAMTGSEVSYATQDTEFGITCKIRVDMECDEIGMYVDVKTTRNATPDSFARDLYNFGYYRSTAFYDRQLRNHYGDDKNIAHAFLVIENDWPCLPVLYHMDEASLMLGKGHVMEALEQVRVCQMTGEWPGYSKLAESISLPNYAFYKEDRDT